MKKQIMSIAAAAALLTTGALAFDYTYDGEIVTDITTATLTSSKVVTGKYASYVGGTPISEDLNLSTNNKGDALIYPAFKAGDEWSSEIVVRNSKNAATVAKVVLYAADNSRELLDFDIHLSPYDVFRFNIATDGTVSTSDGSFALIDPTLTTNDNEFVTHNTETAQVIGKINARAGNEDVVSGYAAIYAMAEAANLTPPFRLNSSNKLITNSPRAITAAYHGKHSKLLVDFRILTDTCRDTDYNASTPVPWRIVLGANSPSIQNGTATDTNVTSPNVAFDCLQTASTLSASPSAAADANATNKKIATMTSTFVSPTSDLLFGDITISKGGEDPRNLLIHATALDNFTAANQMMLWAPGEYAAIQDRRLVDSNNTLARVTSSGYANNSRTGFTDYNLSGIRADSKAFETAKAYYTFDDNELKGANTLLVTQPTKRALIMANPAQTYWVSGSTGISPIANKWGEFRTSSSYYDENENVDTAATTLAVVISPVSGDPLDAYKNELQAINDPERTEASSTAFQGSLENGFAIVTFSTNIPSIISQMTGSVVDGESQINWIYSTTNK